MVSVSSSVGELMFRRYSLASRAFLKCMPWLFHGRHLVVYSHAPSAVEQSPRGAKKYPRYSRIDACIRVCPLPRSHCRRCVEMHDSRGLRGTCTYQPCAFL